MVEDRNEDLRTMVREFRASVSEELAATHRAMNDMADDLRTRITTAETTLLHAIRDLTREMDRRFDTVDSRMGRLEGRMDGLDTRTEGVEDRLDGHSVRLSGIEDALRDR